MKLFVLGAGLSWVAGDATFAAMADCLVAGGVDPTTIAAVGDAQYADWNYQWNLRDPTLPGGYVRVRSEADVQAAVRCGVSVGFPLSIRGGGHSYEKLSMLDGRLVVDLSQLDTIQVIEETVVVGAGVLLGQVYAYLWNHGKLSIPSGSCPSVGAAGLTLGGGYGYSARKYGMLVDRVVSMRVVDATGKILTVDKNNNADLFFALRGAGMASFVIVTQFTYQTFDASSNVNVVSLNYGFSKVTQVMGAWQKWAASSPPNSITATFYISPSYGIAVNAVVQDTAAVAKTVVAAFPTGFSPRNPITQMSYIDMVIQFGDPDNVPDLAALAAVTPQSWPVQYFKAKSLYINQTIPARGLANIANAMAGAPADAFVLLDLQGGKIANPPSNCAFIHRKNLYSVQYIDDASNVEDGEQGFLNRLQAALAPYDSGFSYQNYIDLDLSNPLQRYYGNVLPQLVQTKQQRDPANLFNNPLSIPLH